MRSEATSATAGDEKGRASRNAKADVRPDGERAIELILVEDEPLYRELLRGALSRQPGLAVVGDFGQAEAALAAATRLRPRVAILDIELGGPLNGIQLGLLLRRQQSDIGVVLLSHYQEPAFLTAVPCSQRAGWCYLLKRSVEHLDVLVRAIHSAATGEVMVDPRLAAGLRPRAASPLSRLSPRQIEILSLMAQGLSNAAIADRLVLSVKTVENHIGRIYLALNSQSAAVLPPHPRVQAVLAYLDAARWVGSP